jgi:hypothetical protein
MPVTARGVEFVEKAKVNTANKLGLYGNGKKGVSINPAMGCNLASFALGTRHEEYDKANCMLVKARVCGELQCFLVAIKDIKKGDPIVWYYGLDYDTEDFLPISMMHPDDAQSYRLFGTSSCPSPGSSENSESESPVAGRRLSALFGTSKCSDPGSGVTEPPVKKRRLSARKTGPLATPSPPRA